MDNQDMMTKKQKVNNISAITSISKPIFTKSEGSTPTSIQAPTFAGIKKSHFGPHRNSF